MQKSLTVGELKKALEGVPDDLEVEIIGDIISDQIIVKDAERIKYAVDDCIRDYFAICVDGIDDLESEDEEEWH